MRHELRLYLGRFETLESYRLAYLALHGERGSVWVGRDRVRLEELVELVDEDRWGDAEEDVDAGAGNVLNLTGKVLYLGSCASLARLARPHRAAA